MAAGVYKICACRDQVKCRHPWWFSYKRRGEKFRIRKSLDVVLDKHIDSKVTAEEEANRLRNGIVENTLPARTRELLGLPPSTAPVLQTLTIAQLLNAYKERHLSRLATADTAAYQIGTITRTVLARLDGTSAPFGDWLVLDVTADTLERFREAKLTRSVFESERENGSKKHKGRNVVGGPVAANRDLQLLRAAFNWAIRTGQVKETPFKIGTVTAVKLSTEMARSRRLQGDEAERLLKACGTHLRAVVEAALETGCRRGELLGMQWSQVQMEPPKPNLWLPAHKTKTARARRVPISKRLSAVLEMRRDALRTQLDLKPDEMLSGNLYVFGNEIGQRVGAIKTAWRLTCERAKIADLHFHDLRREAGSRWMDAGVPIATVPRWLGHTNISQTSTYLAGSAGTEYDAMEAFEQRRGRLTPLDTDGGTPLPNRTQSATEQDTGTAESTTKH